MAELFYRALALGLSSELPTLCGQLARRSTAKLCHNQVHMKVARETLLRLAARSSLTQGPALAPAPAWTTQRWVHARRRGGQSRTCSTRLRFCQRFHSAPEAGLPLRCCSCANCSSPLAWAPAQIPFGVSPHPCGGWVRRKLSMGACVHRWCKSVQEVNKSGLVAVLVYVHKQLPSHLELLQLRP